MTWGETFEQPQPGWFFTGGAGFDYGKGLAHRGKGNAWVRGSSGWNAINRFHTVRPRTWYHVYATIRQSPGLTDGYFSVREARELNGNGRILTEQKLGGPCDYFPKSLNFTTGDSDRILLYIGLWGNGKDAWIQIDDFVIDEVGDPGSPQTNPQKPTCVAEVRLDNFGSLATVNVSGAHFDGSEQVNLFLNGSLAASPQANGGTYSSTFSVPQSHPVAHYVLHAQGATSNLRSADTGFDV
jgi:hypothetical protein